MLIKAHIIPDWMYAPLYDDKHKLFAFSSLGDPSKSQRPSTGEYDNTILCSSCDGIMGNFENYGRYVFYEYKGDAIRSDEHQGVTLHHLTEIDYKQFKLFLISLLWKSSITIRDNFKRLTVNTEFKERLKAMIQKSDPGSEDDPAVNIYALHSNEANLLMQIILPPYSSEKLHVFYIAGYLYIFSNSKAELPYPAYCLKEKGEIDILNFAPDDAYTLMEKLYGLDWLRQTK